jgi:hypothetical protein
MLPHPKGVMGVAPEYCFWEFKNELTKMNESRAQMFFFAQSAFSHTSEAN